MARKKLISDAAIVKKYLSSPDLVRKFANESESNPEFLEQAAQFLLQITAEVKDELELKKIEAEEREKERLAIVDMIKSKGWSVEELLNDTLTRTNKKTPAKKYQYENEQGEIKYWSGRGKMPAALQRLLEQGKTLEEFLV